MITPDQPPAVEYHSTKLYRCLYVDPPWDKNVFWNENYTSTYPRMGDDQLLRMGPQVRAICDPIGCHLWMWAVAGKMKLAYEVMHAWGFSEVDFVFWAHDWMRMGRVRHQGEILLFGERGSLPLLSKEELNWEFTPHWRGKHSEKPDQLRRKVERCSPGPRLEMFARSKPPEREQEWDIWGNDCPKNDVELLVPMRLE